jgi:hypothetical protein
MEDEEEARNVSSEHDSVSSEFQVKDRSCKSTDVERDGSNGEQRDKQARLNRRH